MKLRYNMQRACALDVPVHRTNQGHELLDNKHAPGLFSQFVPEQTLDSKSQFHHHKSHNHHHNKHHN